jgi:hypothetical protein
MRVTLARGCACALLAVSALVLGVPLAETYVASGLVLRLPTAVLATGLMLLAGISLGCGLILDSVARGRLEQKRLVCIGLSHLGRNPTAEAAARHATASSGGPLERG